MKAQEYREMNMEELEEQLREKRTELAQQRFEVGSRQLKNYMKLGDTRTEIARILTVMKEIKRDSPKETKENK